MFNSLYPTMLEDLGLTAAIESYLETGNLKFCSFKFDLNTNIRDEVVSKEISLVLYRIFQESMTNIALHAKATKVTADIYIEGEYIRMQIADNGIGFVKLSVNTKEHHGLLVMRERTYAMNGKFNISSTLFKGTTVEVIIPLSERQLNENFF
jgi:signal transduction histidine kinase